MHLMQYRAIFILALHKRNDPSWVMADHSPIHDTKHSDSHENPDRAWFFQGTAKGRAAINGHHKRKNKQFKEIYPARNSCWRVKGHWHIPHKNEIHSRPWVLINIIFWRKKQLLCQHLFLVTEKGSFRNLTRLWKRNKPRERFIFLFPAPSIPLDRWFVPIVEYAYFFVN